jgi:hypothetical protein
VDEKVDDDKPNRGLKPLPNLEFKFVCANSLIGLPESESGTSQEGLFGNFFFEDFSREVNDYFNASNPDEKHRVRERIEALIDGKTTEKFEHIQASNKYVTAHHSREKNRIENQNKQIELMTLWGSYKNLFKNEPVGFFDIQYFFPECKDGFDVVIANPPYGIRMDTKLRDEYGLGNKDSYGLFMVLATKHLLKPNGVLSYIISDTWLTIKTHFKLREQMMEKQMLNVIRLHQDCFMATVNSCIFHLKNTPHTNGNFIAADLTNISTKTELTELNEKLFNLHDYIGTATPNFAVYEYEQDLIKTNSNLPVFVASPKLFALMNDTTCNTVEKDDIQIRQIKMNGQTIELQRFGEIADIKVGLQTGDNKYYLYQNPAVRGNYKDINQYREYLLTENDLDRIVNNEELRTKIINNGFHKSTSEPNFDSDLWFEGKYIIPYDKGGESDTSIRWLPNYFVPSNYFIDWSSLSVKSLLNQKLIRDNSTMPYPRNKTYYFIKGISYSDSGVYAPTFRLNYSSVFDQKGSCIFVDSSAYPIEYFISILTSKLIKYTARNYINSSISMHADSQKEIVIINNFDNRLVDICKDIINKQKEDNLYDYMSNEQKEIDRLVYEIYGLNDDDIKEVEIWYARRYPKLSRFTEID